MRRLKKKQKQKSKEKYRRKAIESERTDMGVILTPGFTLLGKTATRNTSRHSLLPCSETGMGFRILTRTPLSNNWNPLP
jgi:hypothetical protein